jgi:hypothetical protein
MLSRYSLFSNLRSSSDMTAPNQVSRLCLGYHRTAIEYIRWNHRR